MESIKRGQTCVIYLNDGEDLRVYVPAKWFRGTYHEKAFILGGARTTTYRIRVLRVVRPGWVEVRITSESAMDWCYYMPKRTKEHFSMKCRMETDTLVQYMKAREKLITP